MNGKHSDEDVVLRKLAGGKKKVDLNLCGEKTGVSMPLWPLQPRRKAAGERLTRRTRRKRE